MALLAFYRDKKVWVAEVECQLGRRVRSEVLGNRKPYQVVFMGHCRDLGFDSN